MSKFFIEHPVLANVLAIVLVLLGAVSLLRLPVSEYPNVVPPTVQVTASYPGASPQTVIDQVALPIELQVNGVDRMLYMESTSAADGTYNLTVTFQIGTDPDIDQVLVQNRVQLALASLPQPVQAQGVNVQKKSTAILQIVTLDSADNRFDSLFLSNYATINLTNILARLPGVGQVKVFGAGEYSMRVWMDPQKLQSFGLQPSDVIDAIQQQSKRVAAGQVGMPPAPADNSFQYTVDIQSRLNRARRVRRHHRQGPHQAGRRAGPRPGHRPRRAGRPDLRAGFPSRRPAGRRHRDLPDAGGQRAAGRRHGARQDDRAGAPLPAGPALGHPLRHHAVRHRLDRRGLHDALPGRHPGADRDPGVPAELPRHPGAGHHRPGHHHRRLRRHGGARLHRQPVDPVRHRAGDRHRGRRRHRDRRGRDQVHRARHVGPRFGDQGDGRPVRADHRHHARADERVPAGRLRARPHRPDVRPVRARHRRHGADQRGQRRDLEAHPVRAVAAHAGAAGAPQLLLPRLQPDVRSDGERLRRPDRRHGAPRRPDGGPRAGAVGRGAVGHRAAADGVHPDRRPGLPDRRRAAARRRLAQPHDQLAAAGPRPGQGHPGRRPGDRHLRHLAARQQRRPRQRRRRLRHAEAVRRAREGPGPGPAFDLPPRAAGAGDAFRRPADGAAAAGHPGHRQRRRLPDAARDAGRQLRLPQAQRPRQPDRQGGAVRAQRAQRRHDLPHQRPAGRAERRPRPRRDPARLGRRHLLDAHRLCRLDLRQPVQQVRPVAAGLRPGRIRSTACIPTTFSTSTCAARTATWCRWARLPACRRRPRRP